MTDLDLALSPTLLLILLAVPIAAALFRRVPVVGPLAALASWGVLLLFLFIAFGGRAELDPRFGRIVEMIAPESGQRVTGRELRVPMAPDGHFWVEVALAPGVERRMLVDSGATLTALSAATAAQAGLEVRDGPFPVLIQTANGTVRASTAKLPELRLGNIVARELPVVVSPAFGRVNVLGMNFLSRLKSWRVEGRTLILEPHNPQSPLPLAGGGGGGEAARAHTLRR